MRAERFRRKNASNPITKTPATTPTAIPAMEDVASGVEDGDAEAMVGAGVVPLKTKHAHGGPRAEVLRVCARTRTR